MLSDHNQLKMISSRAIAPPMVPGKSASNISKDQSSPPILREGASTSRNVPGGVTARTNHETKDVMHARYQSMPGLVTSATVSRPDPFLAVFAKNSYIGAGGPTAATAAVGKN